MRRFVNFVLVLALLAGLGVLLYPTVSDQYNQYLNAKRISQYSRAAESLDPAECARILEECVAYNEALRAPVIEDAFSGEEEADDSEYTEYMRLLNPNRDGVMGVLEIPRIGVRLPIYHGTHSDVLERGVGHMESTSLPVGGPSTHAAFAGHRGLPAARLFTDLDQMQLGDLFYISVLNQNLVYRVDQILVVEPYEMDTLAIAPGEDHVTLVTCTPYGINTQRLLVRGVRAPLMDISELLAVEDNVEIMSLERSILIFGAPVFLIGFLLVAITGRRRYW